MSLALTMPPPIVIELEDSDSEVDRMQVTTNNAGQFSVLPQAAGRAQQAAQRLEHNVANYLGSILPPQIEGNRYGDYAATVPEPRAAAQSQGPPNQPFYKIRWAPPRVPKVQSDPSNMDRVRALSGQGKPYTGGSNRYTVPPGLLASTSNKNAVVYSSPYSTNPPQASFNSIDSIAAGREPTGIARGSSELGQTGSQSLNTYQRTSSITPGTMSQFDGQSSMAQPIPNTDEAIYNFSISGMRPRFKLNETDSDFRSNYRDKQLGENFKMHLDRHIRTVLIEYEDRLPKEELFYTARKFAERVFKSVARLKQSRKRSTLAAGMATGAFQGLLKESLNARVETPKNRSVQALQAQIRPGNPNVIDLTENSGSSDGSSEDFDSDEGSGISDGLGGPNDSDASDAVQLLPHAAASPGYAFSSQPRASARSRRRQPVNYNLKQMFKASGMPRSPSNSPPDFSRTHSLAKRPRSLTRSPTSSSETQYVAKKLRLEYNRKEGDKDEDKSVKPDDRIRVPIKTMSRLLRARELGMGHFGIFWNNEGFHQDLQEMTFQNLKQWRHWTGASKDVLTAVWSRDGSFWAAGSSTDMDDLNIQYNRPNNLLLGKVLENTVYELPDHHIARPRPETIQSGDNALIETYNAVDPRLFTTVSSLCFDESSTHLYTASFDKTVKIWDINTPGRPLCKASVAHESQVSILSLSQDSAFLASAQHTYEKPVQVFSIQNGLSVVGQYTPERQKQELRLYPTALQWGTISHTKHLLLAGFAENKIGEDEREREGYIGVWDVEYGAQQRVQPCFQTIFDIQWHPYLPIFAAASTTGGNRKKLTNKNAKSLLRVYSPLETVNCLREYECPAIDVNEVRFHPKNEHYISASCTDGVTYIWDDRMPDVILHKLCHGEPHDPLNYRTQSRADRAREREELDTGVRFVDWNEWGTRLYTGSSDGVIKVWDPLVSPDDALVEDLATFDSNVMTGQFSPDGTNILIGLSKGSVQILSCAPPTSQVNEDGSWFVSSMDNEPLTFKPADKALDDEEDEGILASKTLLESGEIAVHPVFGAGKGPAYKGPYSRYARYGVPEEDLAATALDPAWLVTQLYPGVREEGRKKGAAASRTDKTTYRANDVVSWARYAKFHPDVWAKLDVEKQGCTQEAFHVANEVEPFWGGPSTATSRCQSPVSASDAE